MFISLKSCYICSLFVYLFIYLTRCIIHTCRWSPRVLLLSLLLKEMYFFKDKHRRTFYSKSSFLFLHRIWTKQCFCFHLQCSHISLNLLSTGLRKYHFSILHNLILYHFIYFGIIIVVIVVVINAFISSTCFSIHLFFHFTSTVI